MKILSRMAELALRCEALRNPDLRTTTWNVVDHLFAPACPDPELLQKLSHHWLRLERLERLNEELFDRTVGARPAIQDQNVVGGMWGELHTLAFNLHAHATQLIEDLNRSKEHGTTSQM